MNTYLVGDQLVVTRTVTTSDAPWLRRNVMAGETVIMSADLYGCCSRTGIAVEVAGIDGYVELPADAVEAVEPF